MRDYDWLKVDQAQRDIQWLRVEFEKWKYHLHCPKCQMVLELWGNHQGIWQFHCYYDNSQWWKKAFSLEPLHEGTYEEAKIDPQAAPPAATDGGIRAGDATPSTER